MFSGGRVKDSSAQRRPAGGAWCIRAAIRRESFLYECTVCWRFGPMRPRRSTQDWLLEAIAFAALIATFAMVFGHWQRLPAFARRGGGGSLGIMVLLNGGVYLLL